MFKSKKKLNKFKQNFKIIKELIKKLRNLIVLEITKNRKISRGGSALKP